MSSSGEFSPRFERGTGRQFAERIIGLPRTQRRREYFERVTVRQFVEGI